MVGDGFGTDTGGRSLLPAVNCPAVASHTTSGYSVNPHHFSLHHHASTRHELRPERESNPRHAGPEPAALSTELPSQMRVVATTCSTPTPPCRRAPRGSPRYNPYRARQEGLEPSTSGFAGRCSLQSELLPQETSERRESNPLPTAWKAAAHPGELLSHEWTGEGSNLRPAPYQSAALPTELPVQSSPARRRAQLRPFPPCGCSIAPSSRARLRATARERFAD